MPSKVGRFMVGLMGTALFAQDAGDIAQILPPTRLILPEVRAGFPLQKAADYGVAPADYDGDGYADLSIKLDWGTWKIDYAKNGFGAWDETINYWQIPSRLYWEPPATPVPADYDGDGRADLAVKDIWGTWKIDYAKNGFGAWDQTINYPQIPCPRATALPASPATPVPADYDGDGRADIAVKDDCGRWYIDFASDGFLGWNVSYAGYGGSSADPVPADYDGDGRADLAVKDDTGHWRIDYAADGFGAWNASYQGYGGAETHAVPADYDGDGHADLAVKNDDGRWHIDYSTDGFGTFNAVIPNSGGITARAVPADYDGDGRADLGVRVDCGPWFIDYYATNGLGAWDRRFDYLTANGQVEVTNTAQLVAAVVSDFTGTISIPSQATIELTGVHPLVVSSCVCLRGTRRGLDGGALLFTNDKSEKYSLFQVTGHDVRFEGLRFRGPSNSDQSSSQKRVDGILVVVNPRTGQGGNVVIDNNEAWYWTTQAVGVVGQVSVPNEDDVPPGTPLMTYDQAGLVRISRNFLHHNYRETGYGVGVHSGAYATIEGNLFDRNRHAIASDGLPHTGYVARYNYVLEGGYTQSGSWNQHFDVHGTGSHGYGRVAGEQFEIAFNTFRGEQDYAFGLYTRAAFMLRGTPKIGAYFHDNVLVHDNRGEAVRIKSPDCVVPGPAYSDVLCHLFVGPNTYDTDTTRDLAVGDFDGDGREDIFLANGTGWWYSSAGLTEWRFLQASSLRVASLRFGRFDNDLKTDVVFSTGSQWLFSSGGTAAAVVLRSGGTSLAKCVFGNFDGNGRTDALYATGSTWYLSADSRESIWSTVRNSSVAASDLRVGDFDGDGHDDVFLIENGTWSWWKPGWTVSRPLNGALTSSVSGLVVGDFDGDGSDDIAQTSGNGWRWSRFGSSVWASLRGSGGQSQYRDIRSVVIGRFGTDARDVAIRYELVVIPNEFPARFRTGVRFVAWKGTQDAFARWSDQYVR